MTARWSARNGMREMMRHFRPHGLAGARPWRVLVSRQAASLRCLFPALLLLPALTLLECDKPTDTGGCDEPISRDLTRVMYWGEVSGDHWAPNTGYEIGEIRQPVWYANDGIFVRSRRINHGVDENGIFSVAIDPQKNSFVAVHVLTFPDVIRDFDFDATTGDFALTFSRTPNDIQTVLARASGTTFVVVDTILGSSWYPLSARFAKDGMYLYAHDPSTLVNGFYFASLSTPEEDSLLYATSLSVTDARGFDSGSGIVCFGKTDPVDGTTTISVISVANDQGPRSVATLPGAFVSACISPSGSCAVICLEGLEQPGSVVGLLGLATGRFARLNVRTRPCGFVTADFASWSPSGKVFAFSAGGFDSEGGVFPRQLWAKVNAVCP